MIRLDNWRLSKGRLAVTVILLALVATASALAAVFDTFPGDTAGREALAGAGPSWLATAARAVAWLGSPVGAGLSLLGLALLGLAIGSVGMDSAAAGRGRYAVAAVAIGAMDLLTLGVRELIGRPRPDGVVAEFMPATASFPSGHTLHAVLFLGLLTYIMRRRMAPTPRRAVLQGLAVGAMAAVGLSRVYLGYHWPSDVAGGAIFGAIGLWALALWLRGAPSEG